MGTIVPIFINYSWLKTSRNRIFYKFIQGNLNGFIYT